MTQVLGRAFVRAGLRVRVIGLYSADWPAPAYEEDQGVCVWRLPWSPGRIGWLRSRRRLFRQIEAWVAAGDVDLVEVPDWEGMAAWWPRLDVPTVARAHGSDYYFKTELGLAKEWLIWQAERASMRRVDAWCSVSNYLGRKTRDLFALRTGPGAVLYNPVEIPSVDDNPHTVRHRVVFTGTLTPKKGVISLIKAWPKVKAVFDDARLHMVGKDTEWNGQSMRSHLVSLLPECARESVVFHGHEVRERVLALLQTANAAVFPSYAEGMGIAPLEAMACRCPIVSGRCGTEAELFEEGREGLLVDPDSPGEIAHAVCRLLADDNLARRLGEAGRARVERDFSVDALLTRNLAFYDRCLDQFQARRAS